MTNRYTLGTSLGRNLYRLLDNGVPTGAAVASTIIHRIFKSCEITGGSFIDGWFVTGTYSGGEFKGGIFRGGAFNGGEFHAGSYWGGVFNGGVFRGGAYYGGTYDCGDYTGGTVTGSARVYYTPVFDQYGNDLPVHVYGIGQFLEIYPI